MGDPARRPDRFGFVDELGFADEGTAGAGAEPPIEPPNPTINTEPTPPPAPAPVASARPPVHPAETAVTEFGQGAGFELTDELGARVNAIGNWTRSKMGGRDWLTGEPAETAGRGMNAPLKGYDDYLREYAERRAQGKADNPGTAVAANLAGSVASGIAVPQVKAAQGAGLVARGAAGLANVAADTAIGAGTAAAAAEPGNRGEAALRAAPLAAGLSTVLRAPGAIKAGVDAGRRTALSVLPEDVRPGAEALTAGGAEGAAARQAARAGQQTLDPTTRAITKTLSESEEMADAVLDYAKVGLKRAPIVKAMAAEGVDAQKAVMSTGGAVERIAMELDELAARQPGDMEIGGRQAVQYARDAFDAAREQLIEGLGRTADEGGDAAADVYMRVDHLKRQLGRAVKRAGSGASPDQVAEESLTRMYDELRNLLQDESVWGKGAAKVQTEVNAAWTPWLTQRKAFSQSVLADTARKRGANGWDELKEADPAKVSSLLENAGRASNDLKERDLQQGLETTRDLTRSLAKHYDAPPEVVGKAAGVAKGANEVLDSFGQTRENLVKAREMRDFAKEAPKTAKITQAVGAAEDLVRKIPEPVRDVAGGAAATAGAMVEPARKLLAANQGRSSAQAADEAATKRAIDEAAKDPASKALNLAVTDEQYGQDLSNRKGDDRLTRYAVLMRTDTGFRMRQAARAKQLQEQKEQEQEQ